MATNSELRQISVRSVTSTTGTYNEDWIALFDSLSIPAGTFDERFIQYLQAQTSLSTTNLPDLMAAFAQQNGVQMWSELGTFDAGGGIPATNASATIYDGANDHTNWATTPVAVGTNTLISRKSDNAINLSCGVINLNSAPILASAGLVGIMWSVSATATEIRTITGAGPGVSVTGAGVAGMNASGCMAVVFNADGVAMSLLDILSASSMTFGRSNPSSNYLQADVTGWATIAAARDWSADEPYFWNTAPGAGESNVRNPGDNGEKHFQGTTPAQANWDPSATHLNNRGSGVNGTGSNSGDGVSSGTWSPDYVPPPVTPATIAFITGSSFGSGNVSVPDYTFGAFPMGSVGTKRTIGIGFCLEGAGAVAGITLGGVTMTIIDQDVSDGIYVGIARLEIPASDTDTTKAVVVTCTTATGSSCGIIGHEIVTETPVQSDSQIAAGGTTQTISAGQLTVPANGVALCMAAVHLPSNTCTWTGATETADDEQAFRHSRSTAIIESVPGESPEIVAAWTGGGGRMIGAAWGP